MVTNSTRFAIIVTGWNCEPEWVQSCLDSIAQQNYENFTACIVDDASDRIALAGTITRFCIERQWASILRSKHKGALKNQVDAIKLIKPQPDDVLVFVDMDDKLSHPDVLSILATYYQDDTLLTYGSYQSMPYSRTCTPAKPFLPEVIKTNSYRKAGMGYWNHLRTMKYKLFSQLDEADFLDERGEYYQSGGDSAVMFPALELASGKIKFIPEVLYDYNSQNPLSDWRRNQAENTRNLRRILRQPAKQ